MDIQIRTAGFGNANLLLIWIEILHLRIHNRWKRKHIRDKLFQL